MSSSSEQEQKHSASSRKQKPAVFHISFRWSVKEDDQVSYTSYMHNRYNTRSTAFTICDNPYNK